MTVKWAGLLAALAGVALGSNWLGPEKFGHLAATGGIATVGAGAAHELLRADDASAAWYGVAAAVGVGVLKEAYDSQWGEPRRFDLRDLAVDIAGAGLGFAATRAAAGDRLWQSNGTTGEVLAATSFALVAGTLVAGVGVMPWLSAGEARRWCLPVSLVGAGGGALGVASYLMRKHGSGEPGASNQPRGLRPRSELPRWPR